PAAAPAVFAVPAAPARPVLASGLAQYPRATFLDRLAAFALDALLVAIVCELADWNRNEGIFPIVLLAYHIAFWAWRGTTLGGIICSLRVIRTHGAELRPADAIVRGLSSVFSLAALGIGCFWMLQDPESQTWHDKIAGTLVVKVPREMVLP
ncbi:MAG: RDD family protein, partial [Acidobacteriota bacterium]|nr:RDD family protein [Acidobacteriota bacterium]